MLTSERHGDVRKFCLLLVVVLAAHSLAAPDDNEVVNLGAIVQMQRAGLSDDLIAQVVKTAANVHFDVSPDGLIAMKQAGFSETIMRAIMERQYRNNLVSPPEFPSSAASLRRNASPNELRLPAGNQKSFAHQLDRDYGLDPKLGEKIFIQSKAKTPEEALRSKQSEGISVPGAYGRVALQAVTGGFYGGLVRKSAEGFQFDALRGRSAALTLAPGETEFVVQFSAYNDGAYITAEPLLVSAKPTADGLRIISSQKVKASQKGVEPLESKKMSTIPAAIDRKGDTLRLKLLLNESGEYAIVFRSGSELLPLVYDFRVQ